MSGPQARGVEVVRRLGYGAVGVLGTAFLHTWGSPFPSSSPAIMIAVPAAMDKTLVPTRQFSPIAMEAAGLVWHFQCF